MPSLPPSFLPFTLTTLGGLYVALASHWPRLFDRELIKHSLPHSSGYRLGWLIVWQLPLRVGLPLAILFASPALASIFLSGWAVIIVSALMLLIIVACWLVAPPGMRFSIIDRGATMFEMKRSAPFLRSVTLMIIAGMFPAVGVGVVMSWILE